MGVVVPDSDHVPPLRARPARGRPTWWVVLAVSLALMALIAATAAGTPRPGVEHGGRQTTAAAAVTTTTTTRPASLHAATGAATGGATTTTTAAGHDPGSGASADAASLPFGHSIAATTTTQPAPVATATTTTTTSTTTPAGPAPSGQSYPGYLQPPQQSSTTFAFTGQGPTRITAVWGDDTYLTLAVTCSGFDQSTGGSSALALSIPDAAGACSATLAEPSSESTTVSYTLTISPSGG